jgi:hypothetical protein
MKVFKILKFMSFYEDRKVPAPPLNLYSINNIKSILNHMHRVIYKIYHDLF